ncbi:MAG: response regulator transcription factor [Prosthecobacter sp.]
MPSPTRVLIVDDHFFTCIGLTAVLNLEPDIDVVAQAACGSEGISLYTQHEPDVALIDGCLPDMHGIDVARAIRQRFADAHLLMFSVDETEEDIHRAVEAGVSGYVPKSTPRPELLVALRAIAAGRRYFPQRVKEKLHERRCHVSLSPRELEVLSGIASGHPNKIIAVNLNVSAETVKGHVANILEKLGADDRTQAVVTAMERGLLKRG